MYQEFSVIGIETILNKKQIIISVNKDIDLNSMKDTIVEIYDRESKSSVLFIIEVIEKTMILTFKDWPVPNLDYVLSVRGLKSVTGDSLVTSIKKKIKFNSNIINNAFILNPTMFEKIKELNIKLKETALEEKDLKKSYYIEVCTDNAFINTIIKTIVKKDEVELYLPKHSQYYMRARIQEELESTEFGIWSEVITFIFGDINESGEMPDITDPEEPEDPMAPEVDIDDFEIISKLEQGVTPQSLMIEFSKTLNIDSLKDIIVIRKVVR